MNPSDPFEQKQMMMMQHQMENDPYAMYADSMRENKVINVIQQLNPDNLVEDIEHRIRGEKKNSFTGEWELISKTKKTTVSELLISRYVSFLSSILNQNTSLSNFSGNEINNLMIMVVEHIKYDLADNAEEYGFVYINEIDVQEKVKKVMRKFNPDGTTTTTFEELLVNKKKILEEVTDFNEMNRIGMIICGATFSVLKRAMNGAEARRIFGALKVSESLNQMPQKKGFIDSLKFWK